MKYLKVLLLALLCLASCRRPASDELFVRTEDRDADGRYGFVLDMSDSLVTYDVSLVASFDCGKRRFAAFEGTYLRMMWEAPDGPLFEEKVWLGPDVHADRSAFSHHLMTVYRSDLEPQRYGRWRLYISVPEDVVEDFRLGGIGISLLRDGAR